MQSMESPMKLIRAMVRPDKLEGLKDALEHTSVRSITVTIVKYRGPEKRPLLVFRGNQHMADYVERLEIEMVVHDDDVDCVIGTIMRIARTGLPGDGHISVVSVDHQYAIHTGQRDIC